MGASRQEVTAFILKNLDALLPGNGDVPRYKAYLEGLSNAAFAEYIKALGTGEKYLTITAPNGAPISLNLERNLTLGEKLGIKFFQRLWVDGTEDRPAYRTLPEYLVVKLPVRIAAQRLQKKMSIPKSMRAINTLTGQPTGESKGASISFPELRVCSAMGMESSMVELMKYRGGDARGGAAYNASLMRTGHVNLDTMSHFASGVESTATLKTFLTAAHLNNTL